MQTVRPADWSQASLDAMKAFAAPVLRRSILQLCTSLAGYLAGWYAMLRLTEVHYGLTLLLAFLVAGLRSGSSSSFTTASTGRSSARGVPTTSSASSSAFS